MINTILLDKNNHYVDHNGKLPERPKFDKKLLYAFCYNQIVSPAGYNLLPNSIRRVVTIAPRERSEWNLYTPQITKGITIKEIADLSTVLLIIRSKKTIKKGKKFRLNNFHNILKNKYIELWIRNNI